MIKRVLLGEIQTRIDHKKAIIILGARQVGKTSLIKEIANHLPEPYLYFNADEPMVRDAWKPEHVRSLLAAFGSHKLILLDEAQLIEDAGRTLKIIIDQNLGYQFIVTGSSALELANRTYESLTGRKWTFELFPISTQELVNDCGLFEANRQLENRLIYGSYPEVITQKPDAKAVLSNIMQSYLYKDILAIGQVRKPIFLEKILKALAWQMGNEVSLNELSRLTGADVKTVDAYIQLLQQTYIVFSLPSFSRNLRNELSKGKKIFFYDNGIRNALINNYASLPNRNDTGQLWENFLMAERLKFTSYKSTFCNRYFWRTTAQQEIDYVEEINGNISAYEFKWNPDAKTRFPSSFNEAYAPIELKVIHRDNYWEWLTS
jgi:predicted AAA+ superfamily ATPase